MNNRTKRAKTRKAQFSVGMPGSQFDRLTELAEGKGVSRSSYAADVLAKHLAVQEAKAA